MIKALFLDIDGTLVSFKTHRMPQSAVRALAEAHAKGTQLFIATGRPRILINNLFPLEEQGLIDGYVTMNGSYCFTGEDKVVYSNPIPEQDVHTFVNFCNHRDIACVVVYEHDIAVCKPGDCLQTVFYDMLGVSFNIPVLSATELLNGKAVYQLTPFLTQKEEALIRPLVSGCEINRWHPAFIDVTARGNTKQKGIEEMAKHIGISIKDTMAIGDGGNDIPMLKTAGIGVAMGNADASVQAAADYVTADVDHDGLAQALQHFGLVTTPDSNKP